MAKVTTKKKHQRLLYDVETDGFLDVLTKINSLVILDIDTDELISCCDQKGYKSIKYGLRLLAQAKVLIGHNILKFDNAAVNKIYPNLLTHSAFTPDKTYIDTLLISRLIWTNLKEKDFDLLKKIKDGHRPNSSFTAKLLGRHSLEAWGMRLGELKGDYLKARKAAHEILIDAWVTERLPDDFEDLGKGKKTALLKTLTKEANDAILFDPWTDWNKDMQDYCEQDVRVNYALLQLIEKKEYSQEAIQLEHEFAEVILKQEIQGFDFDVPAANDLYGQLLQDKADIEVPLKKLFPAWEIHTEFIPKVNNKARGYVKGVPFDKVQIIEFNPNSRQHIERSFRKKYGWKPKEFGKDGTATINDDILVALYKKHQWPEAKSLAKLFMISKRLGMLAEGRGAWLKAVRDGKIYGSVITNGAVTGRCTHSRPNVAQVPSVNAPYGKECRALFIAPKGFVLVGADASGLELRMLGHFMAKYDKGAYVDILLNGDIHTVNQKAAGLPTRDNAKTFIYGFLYGAGDGKIGQIVKGTAAIGKALKAKFLASLPALKKLQDSVKKKVKATRTLKGLDGRILNIRSPHSALNMLLQSAGALLVKKATIIAYLEMTKRGYVFGKDYANVAHIHDELQLIARKEIADEIGQICTDSFVKAGEYFKLRCPTDGEYKTGCNWAETH